MSVRACTVMRFRGGGAWWGPCSRLKDIMSVEVTRIMIRIRF